MGILWGSIPSLRLSAALPFTIENPDGEWRTSQADHQVSDTISIEAIFFRPGEKQRYVVLRESNPPGPPELSKPFADRIRQLFSTTTQPPASDHDENVMGFSGHLSQFESGRPGHLVLCRVFTFIAEDSAWAVLYLGPAEDKGDGSPFNILHRVPPQPRDAVGMSAFRVSEAPVTGFPIDLEFNGDNNTGRITKIVVSRIPPSSMTERIGLSVGDEIISIDGRKSQEFPLGVTKHSPLGKIFLNREPGDQVKLQVLSPRDKNARSVTLTVPQSAWYRR